MKAVSTRCGIKKQGALGLMQIMPETGSWIAKSTDFPNFKAKMLMLPELNIKFGCWYLSELESEFQGNEIPHACRL